MAIDTSWLAVENPPIVTDAVASLIGDGQLEGWARARFEIASIAFADTVAVMLAGSRSNAATILRESLVDGSAGSHVIVGSSQKTSFLDAVLCNGVAAHALDYDDTLQGLTTHPSCHIVPALIGIAQQFPVTGESVLTSYLVGIEIEARLARTMNPSHYGSGWHSTGTIGTVATAAACARLLKLNGRQIRNALGIACSSASGLRENFGTMTKGLHAGHAARAGAEAAILAMHGFDAVSDPFEHDHGFFEVMNAMPRARNPLEWESDSLREFNSIDQLAFKLYPCCGEASGAVDAAIALSKDFVVGDVENIEIRIDEFAREVLEFDRPRTPDEARFSAPYCVAAAVFQGRLSIGDFESVAITRPEIGRLIALSEVVVDKNASGPRAAEIVVTVNGATTSKRVDVPRGDPSVGFSSSDVGEKFVTCATQVLDRAHAEIILREILDLAQVLDVGRLARGLGSMETQ